MRLGCHVRQLILGPHMGQLIDAVASNVADVYKGLYPEGPVDVTLAFTKVDKDADPMIACDVDLSSDLAVTFLGFADRKGELDATFPYRLSDLSGRISIRPGRIYLTGIHGRLGTGRVACRGEVTGSGLVGLNIDVSGRTSRSTPISWTRSAESQRTRICIFGSSATPRGTRSGSTTDWRRWIISISAESCVSTWRRHDPKESPTPTSSSASNLAAP